MGQTDRQTYRHIDGSQHPLPTIKTQEQVNVGPIRHCEPPHAHSPGVANVARAHRCPRRRRRQRQRVTEGTTMAPWNGPKDLTKQTAQVQSRQL